MRCALAVLLLAACSDDAGSAAVDAGGDAGPRRLSTTGLYADLATKTVAGDLVEFTPNHQLWSDGALKRRWIRLPAAGTIDTADQDHWVFPVGTQFWKEFRGPDGRLLETRLIERVADTGVRETDYWVGAFVWLDDESDAVLDEDGARNVRGSEHDAPASFQCWQCHRGDPPGHILGFSAIQLAGTATMAALAGRMSSPSTEDLTTPATDPRWAALGVLHANCGHCHNPTTTTPGGMDLRLRAAEVATRDPAGTRTYATTVGVPLAVWRVAPFTTRVVAGDPAMSGIWHRMGERSGVNDVPDADQMPPIATEKVDEDGRGKVEAWILGLPRP